MRKLVKPVVIVPALIGVIVSCWVYGKVREKHRLDRALKDAVVDTVSSGPLPKGALIHLENRTDYYETVGRGKVLLVFLTTDCGACTKEIQTLTKTLPRIPSQLAIYGVFFEDRDKVTRFTQGQSIQFPVLLDKGGKIFNALHVRHFPAKILIQDGIIVKTWVGSSPNEDSLLKEIG